MLQRVIEEFKRFCKRIGGHTEVDDQMRSAFCYLETDNYAKPAEYAHEFARLVEKWRPLLKEDFIDLGIKVSGTLLGGYEEYAGISYGSYDDAYYLFANIYSDYSERYGKEREDAEAPKVKKKVLGVPISGEGNIEWNDSTWTWMGVGSVEAKVKDLRKLSEDDIEELMGSILDEARDLANEALETLIEPEEEEEW